MGGWAKRQWESVRRKMGRRTAGKSAEEGTTQLSAVEDQTELEEMEESGEWLADWFDDGRPLFVRLNQGTVPLRQTELSCFSHTPPDWTAREYNDVRWRQFMALFAARFGRTLQEDRRQAQRHLEEKRLHGDASDAPETPDAHTLTDSDTR